MKKTLLILQLFIIVIVSSILSFAKDSVKPKYKVSVLNLLTVSIAEVEAVATAYYNLLTRFRAGNHN